MRQSRSGTHAAMPIDARSVPAAAASALVIGAMLLVAPTAVTQPDAAFRSLRLTAALDPIGPWVDAFDTTVANATRVFDAIADADSGHGSSPADPFAAATFIGVDAASPDGSQLAAHTLDWSHLWGLEYLSGMDMGTKILPIDAVEPAASILTMLSSPISGVLMGLIGPVVSPEVELINSIGTIADSVGAGNYEASLQELMAAPANIVGAFFNGASLNLDALVPTFNDMLQLPGGSSVLSASFDFGGLFTPGDTDAGNVGGSFYNSLGLDLHLEGMEMPYSAPGEADGFVASLVDLMQMLT